MIVELAGELEIPRELPRSQRVAWVQQAERSRKQGIIAKVRTLDPEARVEGGESVFPVLVITTTEQTLAELGRDPAVARISPDEEASLALKSG